MGFFLYRMVTLVIQTMEASFFVSCLLTVSMVLSDHRYAPKVHDNGVQYDCTLQINYESCHGLLPTFILVNCLFTECKMYELSTRVNIRLLVKSYVPCTINNV